MNCTRIAFVVGMVACFSARMSVASPWVYYPSESVISNDDAVGKSTGYVLNVSVLDTSARTLAVGNGSMGDAFKTFGGDTLDLSERIEDSDGAQWTIERLNADCLKNAAALFAHVVFPQELKSSSGQQLNGRQLNTAVLDCPLWEGELPAYFMTSCSTATINLPKITKLGGSSLCAAGSVTDWNLEGVERVSNGAFGWSHQTGTLDLPGLKAMGTVVNNMRYDCVCLGTAGRSLEEVADKAFASPPENLYFFTKEFVIGGAAGWKVGSAAFTANLLKRVVMIGDVPTFADAEVAFGPTNAAAKTIAFYIPKNDARWTDIATAATPLTEDEIAAFTAAHPTWGVPFGIVQKEVFQTANEQYVGWVENRGEYGCAIRASVSNRAAGQYAGDIVTFAVNGKEWTDEGMEFPADCELTVTVTSADSHAKIAWEGVLPDGTTPTGESFTFMLTTPVALIAHFTHPWEYDATAGVISDGYWSLAVKNTSGRELQLGAGKTERTDGRTTSPWAFPADFVASAPAELDLAGPVYTKGKVGDANEVWSIAAIGDKAFTGATKAMSSFYAPLTLKKIGYQAFQQIGSMTNVVFRCPELTGVLGEWGYDFTWEPIERLVLDVPNLTKIYGYNFGAMTLSDADLSDWDLTGLTEIGEKGLKVKDGGVGPKGEVVLPVIETLGAKAFSNWRRVSSAAIGTNGNLKVVGAYLFENNTGLKRLDFGKSSDFTADENAFMAAESTPLAVEEIRFCGRQAPSVAALDALLKGRTLNDDGTKPVIIYAPMSKSSWRSRLSVISSEERAEATALAAKGIRIDGVYETADGRRVAWLAMHPDFNYRGLKIIVR